MFSGTGVREGMILGYVNDNEVVRYEDLNRNSPVYTKRLAFWFPKQTR